MGKIELVLRRGIEGDPSRHSRHSPSFPPLPVIPAKALGHMQ